MQQEGAAGRRGAAYAIAAGAIGSWWDSEVPGGVVPVASAGPHVELAATPPGTDDAQPGHVIHEGKAVGQPAWMIKAVMIWRQPGKGKEGTRCSGACACTQQLRGAGTHSHSSDSKEPDPAKLI